MALLEMNRQRGPAPLVSQWVFDDGVGRISARDSYGNLVMALAVGPLFGPRLAAAFDSAGRVTPSAYGLDDLRKLSSPLR
jgi:hypothetical protein